VVRAKRLGRPESLKAEDDDVDFSSLTLKELRRVAHPAPRHVGDVHRPSMPPRSM